MQPANKIRGTAVVYPIGTDQLFSSLRSSALASVASADRAHRGGPQGPPAEASWLPHSLLNGTPVSVAPPSMSACVRDAEAMQPRLPPEDAAARIWRDSDLSSHMPWASTVNRLPSTSATSGAMASRAASCRHGRWMGSSQQFSRWGTPEGVRSVTKRARLRRNPNVTRLPTFLLVRGECLSESRRGERAQGRRAGEETRGGPGGLRPLWRGTGRREMPPRQLCARGTGSLSAFCRTHHFESVQGRPYPFDD